MTKYEKLINTAHLKGIDVYEVDLGVDIPCGKCIANSIIINNRISEKEKYCILSEELGHYHKTIGNISDQSKIENRKQELVARRWGYEKLIDIMQLIKAYEKGCQSRFEIAEYLNITEEFLDDALLYYRCKYPDGYSINNYWLNFNNGLEILQMF